MEYIIDEMLQREWPVTLYTNRNLLRDQLSRGLDKAGFSHGIRAAGHESELERHLQIVSVQSEYNRVFGTKKRNAVWDHHASKLVLIDEAHLTGGERFAKLLVRHEQDEAIIVGITATPLDMPMKYDQLVQAGTTSELRDCGALLWARHHAINEPDVSKVGTNAVGEYEIQPGEYRKIWMKSVVGSVIGQYRELNPNRLPTILFAPGVAESVWFAERFTEVGIRWAHIDGSTVWLDGESHTGEAGKQLRADILAPETGLIRTGAIKGVSSRFVLREGIDIPELFLGILATVFGDLKSYIQSVGRIMRNHSSLPGYVRLQDHGGNWWRHGSANADRIWQLGQSGWIINAIREERIREGKEPMPLICPSCGALRIAGPTCQSCGKKVDAGRTRQVIQHDGELREVSGPILKPKRIKTGPDVEKLWEQYYYRAKWSKNGMTFRQALGLMFYENHFYPPNNLRLMPKSPADFFLKVKDVPASELL